VLVAIADAAGLTPLHNGSNTPVLFKPEGDGPFGACAPQQSCDVDGFYTPDCEPIKLVNGCIGEFTPEGAIRWECPLFLPEQPELLRKFPRAGQYLLGGPKDDAFLEEHPDWVLQPEQAQNCQCE
jgi:hypothetical protein